MFVRTCPKCAYARKDSDKATPAWQCPSCGIAYEKYGTTVTHKPQARQPEPGDETTQVTLGGMPLFSPRSSKLGIGQKIGLAVILGSAMFMGYNKLIHKDRVSYTTVQRANADLPVAIFYSTAWCPYCKQTRALMDKEGINYVEIDVEKQPGRQEHLREKFHVTGFPIVEVGDEIVVGYQRQDLLNLFTRTRHL